MQHKMTYDNTKNDIIQTTYDYAADDVGRDALAEIRLKRKTGPKRTAYLMSVVIGDRVRLAACPKELFGVRSIGVFSAQASPRCHPAIQIEP